MHIFHRWRTVGYETHGPFLATVTLRIEACSVCGRRRMRIVRGMKPKQ